MKVLLTLIAVTTMFVLGESSSVAAFLFNTGVDNSSMVLSGGSSDPHYSVSSSSAFVKSDPSPNWLANDSISKWISTAPSGSIPGGAYVYATTFSLASISSVTLDGRWAVDNSGTGVFLDGNLIAGSSIAYGTPGNYGFDHWTNFFTSSILSAGNHTLEFRTVNGNGGIDTSGPGGMRAEFLANTSIVPTVPLPPVLGLFAIGLPFVGFVRRRLAKR